MIPAMSQCVKLPRLGPQRGRDSETLLDITQITAPVKREERDVTDQQAREDFRAVDQKTYATPANTTQFRPRP